MKSTELRIGNWVLHKDVIQFVESINDTDSGMAVCCLSEHDNGCQDLKPIPLTEEWLLKLGLKHEKFDWNNEPPNKDVSVGYNGNDFINNEMTFKYKTVLFKITHVHQLQNLYFALTGKELTIKEQK